MSEWKEYSLKDLAFYYNGKAFKPSDWKKEGVKIIRIEQINKPEGLYDYYQGEFPEINKIENGDLIFSWSATLKVVIWKHGNAVLNQHLFKVVPKSMIEKMFLFFILDYNMLKLGDTSHGSTMKHIKRGELEKYFVKVPTPATQRKIAHILTTADAIIEKTQAVIAKYKAIKKGMLHDLFNRGIDTKTGKLRPKYQDAHELYKESKLGWIPKAWEVLQINDCIDPIMSNVDKHIYDNEIKILLCNYMDVYDNRYLGKNISFSDGSVNASEMQRFSLKPQDVIITKDSETPDDIAVPTVLIENIENLICGYHLCILRSKDFQKLNGEFLMLQLQIQEINNQFARKANGSTRYGLTIDAIETVFLKIPTDINEQLEIANRIKSMDNKILTEQIYLHKLQQIKAGLMADLLSGKKEVKVDEEVKTN